MREIFGGLTRGVPGLSAREMVAPASSFEAPENIAAATSLRYSPDKLFLGVIGATIERDPRTGERFAQGGVEIGVSDDRHAVTVAGSRGGKGRAATITNMRFAGSILGIDPRGELALATAAMRSKK